MIENKTIKINDLELLNYMAEEILVNLRFERYKYDSDGSYISMNSDRVRAEEYYEKYKENGKYDYLNFRECEELKKFSFNDALHISAEEIMNKYLKDDLPLMRAIARKGTWDVDAPALDESVSDDYLDQIFALRWKENLKLWTIQWQAKKKRYKVAYAGSDAEYAGVGDAMDTFMMLSEAEFSFMDVNKSDIVKGLMEKGRFIIQYDPSKDPENNEDADQTKKCLDKYLLIEAIGEVIDGLYENIS